MTPRPAPMAASRGKKREIGIIDVAGEITHASALDTLALLRAWYAPATSGVLIVRLNSNGGSVAAAQQIAEAIGALQAQGVHVIAQCGDSVQSAGLYVAAAGDLVLASGTTIMGSVGGIITYKRREISDNLVTLSESVIASGPLKNYDAAHAPDNVAGRDMLQQIVDDVAADFVEWLAVRRNLPPPVVEYLRTGAIFTGRRARELNLVDEIGGYFCALSRAADHIGAASPALTFLAPPSAKPGIVDGLISGAIKKIVERFTT